ncbi:MAG: quinol:electron acceptor oxidoreductase subunit ActD [bacterium]|nr:quinol:electron acceptor oxidoreductase subunit ActD [bacterium]
MEVLGLFEDVERAAAGVEALVSGGFAEEEITSLTSAPLPEGVLVRNEGPSRFRWLTVLGGVVGAGAGFLLAAGTAWLYPLYTGEKAIISMFPVGIITYEFAMLFAILGTIVGMFWEMGLPRFKPRLYDPGIADGLIGILVQCKDKSAQSKAGDILRQAGVVRVREEETA